MLHFIRDARTIFASKLRLRYRQKWFLFESVVATGVFLLKMSLKFRYYEKATKSPTCFDKTVVFKCLNKCYTWQDLGRLNTIVHKAQSHEPKFCPV